MTPAEQEQRVMCEVLQGLGYRDVRIVDDVACWSWGIPVWLAHGRVVAPGGWTGRQGPVCQTPEEAIAWIVANVPRAVVV